MGLARAGMATVFPEPIGLASTFDVPLVHNMAVDISTEARAKYNQSIRAGRHVIFEGLDFWSPNINIFRDPRWGRGQETYGPAHPGRSFWAPKAARFPCSRGFRRHLQNFTRIDRFITGCGSGMVFE
jgi:hypothetical protein